MAPKVTCICPTGNREEYLPMAVHCFLAQTYKDAELLIIDDGLQPNHDFIDEVFPCDELDGRIRYRWVSPHEHGARMNIGTKRNYLCELARGEIIAHWDDDDWYAPERLASQLFDMKVTGKPFVGHHSITYWDMDAQQGFKFVQEAKYSRPYASGTSMMYRKDYWAHVRFQNIARAEDSNFSEYGRANKYLASTDGTQLVVARAHRDSTAPVSADQHACFPSVPLSAVPARFLSDIGFSCQPHA